MDICDGAAPSQVKNSATEKSQKEQISDNIMNEPGLVLYHYPLSAPVRSVTLLLKILDLDVTYKEVDIWSGEQFKPEFLKLNPQHSVPVLVDDGFCLTESRAIMIYLARSYGKDSGYYPRDIKKSAIVNQMLYFDASLWGNLQSYLLSVLMFHKKPEEACVNKIYELLGILNIYLEDNTWIAGDNVTVADISLISSVSTAETCLIEIHKYPNIMDWYKKCKSTFGPHKYEEVMQSASDTLGRNFKNGLDKLK